MNWILACKVDEIEQEGAVRFDHAGKTYAIFRSPTDEIYCTDGLCTHEAIHLADGLVMEYEIECPKHSGVFDYRTGQAKRLPACKNLNVYETRIDNGVVHLLL